MISPIPDIGSHQQRHFRSEGHAQHFSTSKLLIDVMTRLPEDVTDPFHPVAGRIRACASLYRFGNDSSGLMTWAVAQTGLQDPMDQIPRMNWNLSLEDGVKSVTVPFAI